MQRYDLVGDYDLSMAPISDGDYVLYDDAKAEIDRLRAALEKYRGQVNKHGEHTAEEDLMGHNIVLDCK